MPDEPLDPHRTLGVDQGASLDEIHAAYRRRSRSAHPDAGGSDDEFRRVRQAYDALVGGVDGAATHDDPGATRPGPDQPAAAPLGPTARQEPARSPSSGGGCVVAVLATAALVGLVILVALLASTGGSSSTRSSSGSAPPATDAEAFARWRTEHQALVTAIVANGQDVGAALSSPGGVAVGPLQDACDRRLRLLDELEAASPAPRDDVTRAIRGFVATERRAMAACLASPPSFDDLATWGARGQPDLQTIIRATQPG